MTTASSLSAPARSHAALASLLLLAACGRLDMEKHYANYRAYLLDGRYAEAAEYVEGKKEWYGEKNRLLYYMDHGALLSLAGQHQRSNEVLEKAKDAAEELWTESISENALAWVTTDNSLSYAGEDFEKVLIHYIAAQNYLALSNFDAARVEARQITNRLELYNQKYDELEADPNVYRDDAFARWLAGLLAETEGGQSALNDAWIDYKKALAVYETDYSRYGTGVPEPLVADALRVLTALGADFEPELRELRAKYPDVTFVSQSEIATRGRIIVLHGAGEAPVKRDDYWTAPIDGDVLRIAFPVFVPRPHRIANVRVTAGGATAQGTLAEDITSIAIQNLADHMGRIKAKAIARAVGKFTAGRIAQRAGAKEGGTGGAIAFLAGKAWNIGHAIAEEADKRSWVTLPSRVNLAQLLVAPGEVQLEAEYLTAGGQRAGRNEARRLNVQAGQTVFVTLRTFE